MMRTGRRQVVMGLAATALAGCARGIGSAPPAEVMRAAPNPDWDRWVAAFRARAAQGGISSQTLSRGFRGAGYLPGVIARDRNQAEFKRSIEDYLAIAASDERVARGREMLQRHRDLLRRIETRFGVDARIVTAIWGMESRYGAHRGDIPVISATSTLAFDGRRGAFYERQLMAALRILQNGDTTPARLTGSWAGAMGHTQFIPTTYEAFAVDFTGDGRRDIWSDDPADALASAAAYLQRSGWKTGQPWGIEVRLPADFDPRLAGRTPRRPVAEWAAMGVRDMDGRSVPDHGPAAILLPAGPQGPAFMAFGNFRVLTRYNNADSYVIAVGHLGDRITGGPPIRGRFPPDAQGMTRADRLEMQRLLNARGFDAGRPDGVIGPRTIAAIRAFQKTAGLQVTGQASPALLARLRAS